MIYSYVWVVCVTWRIHMCDMTHSHVKCLYSYIVDNIIDTGGRWHMCDMTHSCVIWLNHNMWHDSFVCVIWLINMWHDSFIREVALFICSWQSYLHWWPCVTCVTWLNHMCDVTHPSFVWHDSFVCVIWLIYVTWLIPLGMAHSYVVDDMIDTFGR